MTVKVSVVVAVYNSVKYIEVCLSSLVRQSLTPDEFEVFCVNDDSTDETPARLDQLAAGHPYRHIIRQESPSWSDRWMDDYGKANDADAVIAKMAGIRRPVPQELVRVNWPRATVEKALLIDSLTPHEMFRREFRRARHALQGGPPPGGPRLRRRGVSACQERRRPRRRPHHPGRRLQRRVQRFDPAGYFGNLREALDLVEDLTEPGALRDKLYSHWLRNEMVERLRGQRLFKLPEDHTEELYREIHGVVTERFGPGVSARLALTQRVVVGLTVTDRYQGIRAPVQWEAGIRPTGTLTPLTWQNGSLDIAFDAEMQIDGEPMTFRRDGDRDPLALALSDEALKAPTDQGVKLDASLDKSDVDLVVRHREDTWHFYLPVKSEPHREPTGDGVFRQRISARSVLNLQTAAAGGPLDKGIWDLRLRINSCGWSKKTRLGTVRGEDVEAGRTAALTDDPARLVLPYWTDGPGNLSLDVGQHTGKLGGEAVARVDPSVASIDGVTVRLPLHIMVGGGEPLRLHFERNVGKYPADAVSDGAVPTARPLLEQLTGRRWAVQIKVSSVDRVEPRRTRLPVDLVVTKDGTAWHIAPAKKSPPKKPAPARLLLRRAAVRHKRAPLCNQQKKI
ncbi:glycosyltransferase family A protein [Streptomyces wuyuanensis]|uniref:glycosyltransferase family A protein n=1 Tax=Streptomyces wuyuanensis TaxID=1196353 RepID=UPI003D70CFB4